MNRRVGSMLTALMIATTWVAPGAAIADERPIVREQTVGFVRAMDGNTMVVIGDVKIWTYEVVDGAWRPTTKQSQFGLDIYHAALSGRWMATTSNDEHTTVHAFWRRTASGWDQSQTLEFAEHVGGDVAIAGRYAAFGFPNEHKIVVYQRQRATWVEVATVQVDQEGFGEQIEIAGNQLLAMSFDAALDEYVVHSFDRRKDFTVDEVVTAPPGLEFTSRSKIAASKRLLIVGAYGETANAATYRYTIQGWHALRPIEVTNTARASLPTTIDTDGRFVTMDRSDVYRRAGRSWYLLDSIDTELSPQPRDSGGTWFHIAYPYLAWTEFVRGSPDRYFLKVWDLTTCGGRSITHMGTVLDDRITGTDGPDVIAGLGGDDVIKGLGGDDIICAGPGDDRILPGTGSDLVQGGEGTDEVAYLDLETGIVFDGVLSTTTVGSDTDTIESVESIVGSNHDDVFKGDPRGSDVFFGADGDDTFTAANVPGYRPAFDLLDGGRGIDIIDVSESEYPAGYTIDLTNRHNSRNIEFTGIEGVIGSPGADWIRGDDGDNLLSGGPGNDFIQGNGGNDVLLGDDGDDTVSFEDSPAGIFLDVATAAVFGNGADRFGGFEAYVGTEFDDKLVGGDADETFYGGDGNDEIHGGGGNDTLEGEKGEDWLAGDAGDDEVLGGWHDDIYVGGPGDDVFRDTENPGKTGNTVTYEFAPGPVEARLGGIATGDGTDRLIGIQNIIGSPFDDRLVAGSQDAIILPLAGNDTVMNPHGVKVQISYAHFTADLDIDLVAGTATGEGSDTLIGVTDIVGGSGNDTIRGSSASNDMWGVDGDDRLYGYSGRDYLDGGPGSDYTDGGADEDICVDAENWSSCDHRFYRTGVKLGVPQTQIGLSPRLRL